uniref:Sosondowah ankyrin repeat domain family Cb n=1 Tax=Salmo trutta TaxID=8032 RepID=A0A674F6D1_SALTR
MATECTQEAVVQFLTERGGRVKKQEFIDSFKAVFPEDHDQKAIVREKFKGYVDNVAFVKLENGVKCVCLKNKYRVAKDSAYNGNGTERAASTRSVVQNNSLSDIMGNALGLGGNGEQKLTKEDIQTLQPRDTPQIAVIETSSLPTAADGTMFHLPGPPFPTNVQDSLDSDSASVVSSTTDEDRASVTLDPLEHEWMMCAADGQWESLHRLLSCEPNLAMKKDFVTGFTCLHWAAKQGKQELLALIVNFAKQHTVPININARSSAGYTPLHLAAMHNHVEVVKLLVGAYDADVEARDYNGKRACQYLMNSVAVDIRDIIGAGGGADSDSEDTDDGGHWRLSKELYVSQGTLLLSVW